MIRTWMVPLLGWACSSSPDKPAHIVPADTAATSADTGSPDTASADTAQTDTAAADTADPGPDTTPGTVVIEPPEPSLSAEAVAVAIETALSPGIPEPLGARRAYIDALDHRDAFCPGGGDLSIIGEWEGCLADSGWRFAGYTEYTGETERAAIADFHLLADFRFHDPMDRMFIGGGELDLSVSTTGGDRTWSSQVSGTFAYEGAEGWMAPVGSSAAIEAP